VRPQTSSPTVEAQVVVFPAETQKWIDAGSSSRRASVVRATSTGDYRVSRLPPGDYFIAAVDAELPVDLRDASLITTLSKSALRITLGDGEKKTQPLTLTQAR
jgi:hypothetical protein